MAYRTTVFILSLAVVLSYSAIVHESATISLDKPFNYTFGPTNLHSVASLSITYTLPVSVCIVPAQFGLPHWTQYSSDVCTFYFNWTTSPSNANVALLNTRYTVGVYLAFKDIKKEDNTTITLDVTGDVCSAGYWDGANCVAASPITGFNTTYKATFAKGETKYWSFQNPTRVGNFALKVRASENLDVEKMVMWARYNGNPSSDHHDASDTNGTLSLGAPKPGVWVFAIHASDVGSVDFDFDGQVCGVGHAGADCATPVVDAFNNMTLVAFPGVFHYFRFVATKEQGLLVSVTTANGTDNPYLFASYGQIPTSRDTADVMNCNREYCNIVRSIAYNVTGDSEEWFIGVTASVATGNTTYGIWFNSTCVPGCQDQNHGSCNPEGTCTCEIDFEGIDCSTSKGLGPQYIVLIIIASLVVASAIIGFVAWAYMRRKRTNYETLS